jgi:hypothetical protein
MSPTITIHKLDHQGREIIRYRGHVLESDENRIRLLAIFEHDDVELDGIHLQRGDRMLETFYRQRWYNVFEVHAGTEERFKGWYCNLARPAVFEKGHIRSEDLALDLLIYPDRSWRLLDEADYQALPLSEYDRARVALALDELKKLAAQAQPPFEDPEYSAKG